VSRCAELEAEPLVSTAAYLDMPTLQQPEFYLGDVAGKFNETDELLDAKTGTKIEEVRTASMPWITWIRKFNRASASVRSGSGSRDCFVRQCRLKYCTARSCFSAALRDLNVPRFLRRPVRGFFLREYNR